MATQFEIDCALMSGAAYVSTRPNKNKFPIPEGWSDFFHVPNASFPTSAGFEALSFRNGNQIVIAYAGTYPKDISGDIATDLALAEGSNAQLISPAQQLIQAAQYYLQIKAANPSADITFTGHSLGGGLASLMGVFFNEPTVTFNQAPFRNSANHDIAVQLKTILEESFPIGTYPQITTWLAPLARFIDACSVFDPFGLLNPADGLTARESNVKDFNIPGEFLSLPAVPFDRIGSETSIAPGITDLALTVELHSQALMSAFLLSEQTAPLQSFRGVTFKLPDALRLIFDSNLYSNETDTTEENFLERLIRHEVGNTPDGIQADAMLTRFTADLWKLAQPGGLTVKDGSGPYLNAMNDVSKALTAFAMQMYYESANATDASKQLFSTGNGFVTFDMQDVASSLTQAKGYALYFKNYLQNGLVFTTEERNLIEPALANMRDWFVQAGSVGMLATANTGRSAFMLGGSGSDTMTGSNQADLLVGNAGGDVLYGMAGNDTLIGGAGSDYLDGGADDDTLNGGTGNDLLMGGTGHNILAGGLGDDVYYLTTGSGNTNQIMETREADGKIHGSLFINNAYSGSLSDSAGLWVKDPTRTNTWVSTANTSMFLTHNSPWRIVLDDGSEIQIGEFVDGDYGMQLADYTPPEAPSTTRTIQGDLAPQDQDLYLAGIQTGDDELGNLITDPATPEPDRADTLYGSAGADHIIGGGGNDALRDERGGNDLLEGGDGNDTLDGGAGDDLLYANAIINLNTAIIQNAMQAGSDLNGESLDGGDGNDVLIGDAGNDTLTGGNGNDMLVAGGGSDNLYGDISSQSDVGGNDVLYGQAGNDTLNAGAGDDVLDGGNDNDTLYGDAGVDMLLGSNGNDNLYGGAGKDSLYGGMGIDTLYGGEDDDEIDGGDGDDNLYAGLGHDILNGSAGNDSLNGEDGDDTLSGGEGEDDIDGGAGNDTLNGDDGDDFLHGDLGNDILNGDAGDDYMVGDEGSDSLYGGDGNDALHAKESNPPATLTESGDLLDGGSGDDSLEGNDDASGSDTLYGGDGNDELLALGGNDILEGGSGDDLMSGNAGNDFLDGGSGNDHIFDGEGNDTVYAGDGDDWLSSDDGVNDNDMLYGGNGSDTYLVDNDGDIVIEAFNEGIDLVVSDINYSLPANVENLYLDYGAGSINGIGNELNNSLKGNVASNILDGGAGDDFIFAMQGDDTIKGGTGNDTIWGWIGNDVLMGGEGDDRYWFDVNDGADQIVETSGNDRIVFGTITPSQITASRANGEITLTVSSGDGIRFADLGSNTYAVEQFEFADGSIKDAAWVTALLNTPPDGADKIITLNEDTAYTLSATDFGFTDANFDDSLSAVRIASLPTAGSLKLNGLAVTVGQVIAAANIVNLVFMPAANANGTNYASLTFSVKDQYGAFDTAPNTLSFSVTALNDAPVLTHNQATLADATVDTAYTVTLAQLIQGYTDADGDSLNITTLAADHGAVIDHQNGTYTITPAANYTGTVILSYIVTDGNGGNTSGTLDFSLPTSATITYTGDEADNVLTGSAGNDVLNGLGGNDTLIGGSGNDTLNGGAGVDQMQGGAGNDTYMVDNADDTVIEELDGGIDTVQVNIAMQTWQPSNTVYTLGANVENGIIAAPTEPPPIIVTATGATTTAGSLYGNALNNTLHGATILTNYLYGNAGNDSLYGGNYQDMLVGGDGDDYIDGGAGSDNIAYHTASTGVTVNLSITGAQNTVGAGIDTLLNVENILGSSYNDHLTGNAANNRFQSMGGNDVIDGGVGAFDLIEFTNVFAAVNVNMTGWTIQSTDMQRIGIITLSNIEGVSGSIYNDTLTGSSGADYLNGYAGSDIVNGGDGDDYLAGGSSADTLTGGEGKDTFMLGSDRGLGIQNGVDTITDFNLTDDSFRLISADFTAFIGMAGTLASNNFVAGADKTTATDADDYIIYNSSNGNVFYDADGSGSSYSSVLIADITDGLALTHSHFIVSDSVFIV
jgi:Ca2+-binding RTX toxin-like protein